MLLNRQILAVVLKILDHQSKIYQRIAFSYLPTKINQTNIQVNLQINQCR